MNLDIGNFDSILCYEDNKVNGDLNMSIWNSVNTELDKLDNFFKEFDDMFSSVSYVRENGLGSPIDTADEDLTSYHLKIEAAGFTKDELKIEVENRVVSIKGTSKKLNRTISKYFTAPKAINPSSVNAKFENGLLELTITKAESATKVKINIE